MWGRLINESCDADDIMITSLQVKKITKEGETMTVQLTCPGGDNILTGVDCVLYAIGRAPNTSDLGLDIPVCVKSLISFSYKSYSIGGEG